MEEVDKNPQLCTTYNLQPGKPLVFDSTTLYVKNIPEYYTNEAFSKLMSKNGRRIKKYHLFPPKYNDVTTFGLVTFKSQAEAEDAIYWLNRTPPHRFILQYAKYSTKEIKNCCNPWWSVACEDAYIMQRRAWNNYHKKPTPQNLNDYKKAKSFFKKIRRQSEKGHTESIVRKMRVENTNAEVENETESIPEPEPVMEVEAIKKEKSDDAFAFSSHPNLETIRQEVAKFAEERNWNMYHQPRNLLLALVGEMGELSELFQWRGEVQTGLPGWTEKEKARVGEELSDVLIYLIRLSDKCQIDLPSAVMEKIALNEKKYPASKCYGSSKKYTEYQADS